MSAPTGVAAQGNRARGMPPVGRRTRKMEVEEAVEGDGGDEEENKGEDEEEEQRQVFFVSIRSAGSGRLGAQP